MSFGAVHPCLSSLQPRWAGSPLRYDKLQGITAKANKGFVLTSKFYNGKVQSMLNNLKFILSFIFLFFFFVTPVYAIDITLQWTPNNEPNLAGYRVFYFEESQSYNYLDPYWETIDPICTINDLDETKTYYFVVRAFDTNGLESANSNEVLLIEGVPENNP